MTRMLEKASPGAGQAAAAEDRKRSRQAEDCKLAHAGFRSEAAPSLFLGLKFAVLIAGLFLGGGTVLIVAHLNGMPLLDTRTCSSAS